MHDFAFAECARPARFAVLGCPLLPYTIGHEILLWRYQNPLLGLTREQFDALPATEQVAALTRAVTICTRTWRETLQGGFFLPRVRTRGPRLARVPFWRRWWNRPPTAAAPEVLDAGTDWPVEIAEFRNYLAAGRYLFPSPDPQADHICARTNGYDSSRDCRGRSFGAPHAAQLINFCLARPALMDGVSSVYDLPLALTSALYFTHLESEGSLRIENAEEYRLKHELAEKIADLKKRSAAAPPPANATGLATPPPAL